MAKRKMSAKQRKYFGRAKTRTRTVYKTVRSRRSKGITGLTGQLLGAGLYGAFRGRTSQMLSPYTSRIPAGELADEVGMGILAYLLAKGKIPFIKKIAVSREIGKAGLYIEAARVGSFLAQRGLGGLMPSSSGSTAANNSF